MSWQTSDMIPVYGFLEGDTLGLLLVTHSTEKVRDLTARLRKACSVRVAIEGEMDLVYDGRRVDPEWTVSRASIRPLDRIDVVRREGP